MKNDKTVQLEAAFNRDAAVWRKSTRSGPWTDNCVEVAIFTGGVAIRDSKNPDGPVLLYTNDEFEAFVLGARDGEFDNVA